MLSDSLKHLHERGLIKDCSNLVDLDAILAKEKVIFYLGFDLTAPSLHAGNLMTIMLARPFVRAGHKLICLLGGATTKIGDPTGKDQSRKILSEEEIAKNYAGIKKCLLQFFKADEIILVNNNDWFQGINYIDFLRSVGQHFSVNRMVAMDSVRLRLERQQSMSFIEFNYMIMQGYDFWHLYENFNCRLQIGGSDQWGNISQGVDLVPRMLHVNNKTRKDIPAFGLTCPLLTRSDGKKMGKSESGAVWLSQDMLSPYDYFQYFRNTDDRDIKTFLYFFTDLTSNEIEALAMLSGKESNKAKDILAFEATKICHGASAAETALNTATKIFSGEIISDMPTINVIKGENIISILVQSGLCDSKTSARRLIEQNAVKLNGEIVSDVNFQITIDSTLMVGKKKHVRLISQ